MNKPAQQQEEFIFIGSSQFDDIPSHLSEQYPFDNTADLLSQPDNFQIPSSPIITEIN